MEKEIQRIRVCRVCRWLTNSTHWNTLICSRAVPNYVPIRQIFTYKKALVTRYWDSDCEKFKNKHSY